MALQTKHMLQRCFAVIIILCAALPALAQRWPYDIKTADGTITVYEPQPQSLNNNKLSAIAAISVTRGQQDPVFGAVWLDATVSTDRDTRMVSMQELQVQGMKFPGDSDETRLAQLKSLLEQELPNQELNISMDELSSTLSGKTGNVGGDQGLDNTPPTIIFKEQNSLLVQVDGQPQLLTDKDLGLPRVQNTPYLMLQPKANQPYYLYFGGRWFSANILTGQWKYVSNPPAALKTVAQKVDAGDDTPPISLDSLPLIVVSTVPAELIQSQGKPNFSGIAGTSLLYMSNTKDNIFMDINSQQYYVLLTGRWFKAANLAGPWTFVDASALPPDFAKIPEGNDKDAVLASVAGTDASKEAVLDAQVPQTAKVDRKTATTSVTYDGDPQFEDVSGTGIAYADNTQATVLREDRTYYVVDNGVWFTGPGPNGPWTVATTRPPDVDRIPPSAPVYNVRYVYIYDVRPDVVYMGYTPGYTGCYVMGPTVVYGTGFRYAPWYRHYYYPRPWTWGFGMRYNPWWGWSMGVGMNYGVFHFGIGFSFGMGGWWGPPVYRPPFAYPWRHVYGPRPVYRPRPTPYRTGGNNFYGNRTNNIYSNRPNVITRDRVPSRPGGVVRPGTRPGMGNGTRPVTRPGGDVGTNPGVRPGTRPGGNNGTNPGINPGTRPVTRPGGDAGTINPGTRPVTRPGGDAGTINPGTRPGTRPGNTIQPANPNNRLPPTSPTNPSTRPGNTIQPANPGNRLPANTRQRPTMADQQGNVYQRNPSGDWQQRQGNQYAPANGATRQNMEQQYQQRQRANQNTRNFQQGSPPRQSAPVNRSPAPSNRSTTPSRSAPRGRQ